ncbi:recombinase family protein [Micromonospora inyonensis]|uniref:Site-specific DNA recombinase n=1 Tax=Micromonospora inyonensis TaxID=47866 RepID=A0A1C6S5D5_9ACTN|nr:recombinase family protein [Micromonospora inyonensis]SCL24699.1 Site-specific DNA recombinase [Micromonospora inyonensis]
MTTPRPKPFAFYGRVSTEDNQDPESSRSWQLSRATALIQPHGGRIVAEYFDIGQSRSLPWQRRVQASQLLTALRTPQRGFTAVVVGEPHRAFYGNQFGLTVPLFAHYGVELWVPEIGGPIDPDNEAHELVMSVFGGMSKGERNRIKLRVRTAMAAQTLLEGRYLGGRPPYGYTLRDLGPHPNPAKAADGKRLRALTPDPDTAPIVRRIFDEFLAGYGLFAIAEGLTANHVPCPSAHDRARNPHRSGIAWSKSAIRVILTNPRYTGRQVWNKQRTDEVLLDVDDVALGHTGVMRWNTRDKWIISKEVVHPPLIDDATFEQAQTLLGQRARRESGNQRLRRARNPYVFRGLVYCAACQRRMQGQHNHGDAYYRCRIPQEYALANDVDHPRNVYLREDALIAPLDTWLATAFTPGRIADTITAMANTEPDHTPTATAAARAAIADCDAKLERYRAALDSGADPAVVTGWIAQTQAERTRAEAHLQMIQTTGPRPMSRTEITNLVHALGDITTVLRDADPADKAKVYRQLGLRLVYHPETQTARAEVKLNADRGCMDRVRGGT